MYYVSTLCDRALWLNAGRVAAEGDSQTVVLEYERFLARKDAPRGAARDRGRPTPRAHARFRGVVVDGRGGAPEDEFRPGEPWVVELEFAADTRSGLFRSISRSPTRDNVVLFLGGLAARRLRAVRRAERYRVRVGVDTAAAREGGVRRLRLRRDETALALFDARSDRTFHVESDTWRSGLMSVPAAWERVTPGSTEMRIVYVVESLELVGRRQGRSSSTRRGSAPAATT